MKYLLIICILFLASCETKSERHTRETLEKVNEMASENLNKIRKINSDLKEYLERKREHDSKYGEIIY